MQLEVGGNTQAVVSPCFLLTHHPPVLSDVESGARALLHQFGPVRNSDDRMTQSSREGARWWIAAATSSSSIVSSDDYEDRAVRDDKKEAVHVAMMMHHSVPPLGFISGQKSRVSCRHTFFKDRVRADWISVVGCCVDGGRRSEVEVSEGHSHFTLSLRFWGSFPID